jgi:galactose mutarotase-like enzyme
MSFHEAQSVDDATLDFLTREDLGLRIAVNRAGAELISLARRNDSGEWTGFLYRDGVVSAPESGWGNHATVMGYFLHRLWQEKSLYRGKLITGGNHGFIRHFIFDAPTVGEDSLTYHVPADRVPPEAYPLKVSFDLTYRLTEAGLWIEFSFTNHEPELDAHVSFGLHPGFAVTSVLDSKLILPAGTYVRHLAPGNFLSGELETVEHAGGESPFPKADLLGSYIVGLSGVPERQLILEDPAAQRRVRLDFSQVPYLTLWSDMHPFVCVEPCWGLPDSNPPTAFEDKPGIQIIPAGQTLRRGVGLNPEFLT